MNYTIADLFANRSDDGVEEIICDGYQFKFEDSFYDDTRMVTIYKYTNTDRKERIISIHYVPIPADGANKYTIHNMMNSNDAKRIMGFNVIATDTLDILNQIEPNIFDTVKKIIDSAKAA